MNTLLRGSSQLALTVWQVVCRYQSVDWQVVIQRGCSWHWIVRRTDRQTATWQ